MTLLELTFVTSILVVGFLALSQSIVASMQVTRVNRETALASDGLRGMIEQLQGSTDFASVFRQHNSDPDDDLWPGPAPGPAFDVPGLQADPDDPDGRVGEIVFPEAVGAGGVELVEALDEPDLSMPRDLDGDGDVDATNVENSYRLLPVLVRLRWSGRSGVRTMELRTLLAER
jgi:type II secretory pathway pseudopilin PulG